MQIWPILHAARRKAAEDYQIDLIYTDWTDYLAHLAEDRNIIDEELNLPTTDRDYWTIRDALTRIIARTAMIQQDGDHGPDEDPPERPNQPYPAFLHAAGTAATSADQPDALPGHWETLRLLLDQAHQTLTAEHEIPPEARDRTAILNALDAIAARTALFTARARLTVHDTDPHTDQNYAVHAWLDDQWTTVENNCDAGYEPDPPETPGTYAGETICRACRQAGPWPIGHVEFINAQSDTTTRTGLWTWGSGGNFANWWSADGYYTPDRSASSWLTWTLTDLPAGDYKIAITWEQNQYADPSAPITVYDDTTQVATRTLNQRSAPDDFSDEDFPWEIIAQTPIDSGTLNVKIGTTYRYGFARADCIRVERIS